MDKNEEYWKFVESERHFNEIQSGIRNLASGWMLAAFGGIALLLKVVKDAPWIVPPALLVAVVSCMATLGLLVLWIIDQLVYERLLNSNFLVGLKKEFDDPNLPPVRCMMLYATEGKGMSRWMRLFYLIPMVGFCAITAASFWLGMGGADSAKFCGWPVTLWVVVALGIAQLLAACWVVFQWGKVSSSNRAEAFGDPKFTALFTGKPEVRKAGLAGLIARSNLGGKVKQGGGTP
jgi:hypothetical protein